MSFVETVEFLFILPGAKSKKNLQDFLERNFFDVKGKEAGPMKKPTAAEFCLNA